jgi:hypothetical protein
MSQTTDDLIRSLSADLPKVAPGAVGRRVAVGLGLGGVASAILMTAWLGPRPDLVQAVTTPMFWMKLGYAAATGGIAALLLARLARPVARAGALTVLALGPFALVALVAVVRMTQAPQAARHAMLMGHSAMLCPWRILAIGLPALVGAVWAVRGLAPTRLALAGLVAGAAAGGIGAAIYAVACDETSAPFLAIWYTLGMAVLAGIGALAGSRLLRWR